MPILGIKERRKHRGREVAHTLSTPGVEIELIFALPCVYVPQFEILADFLNFHIWTWNLEFEERSQSCICALFLPQGVKIKLFFCSTDRRFRDRGRFSKLPYLGIKPGIWKKVPDVVCEPSFYPRGSKLSLFLLYGQWFMRYGSIFKIYIFGHVKPGI